MRLIDADEMYKCETCAHRNDNGVCHEWCESGEVYSPAMNKFSTIEAEPVQKWISVKDTEHKPRHGKEYLCVCTLDKYPDERWLQVLRWYADENGNGYVHRPHFADEGYCGMIVTHWAEKPNLPPLPEPPETKEDTP